MTIKSKKRLGETEYSKRSTTAPAEVSSVLAAALKKYGLDQEIARYSFVTKWPEIVGPEIAKRSRPECFRNGALVIRVVSSAWAQELSFQRHAILTRLRRYIGKDTVVRDLSFCVGEIR